ncbi:MAG: hypothetical protein H5T73_10415 [Actinobacteria bacterium]|nr:hypothetical protein [Actinomycetota bacterium]
MHFTLVIPSYWGRRRGEPFNHEDAVYDHPTPLDAEGTLTRALESIRILRYPRFRVLVLGVATHPDLEEEVEGRLREMVAPFREHFPVALLTHSHEREMKDILQRGGNGAYADMLSLRGYANIRNFCLVAACLDGAEGAVLFDDDEVYEDPHYLDKVAEVLGREWRGRFVGGLAGYYVNADGGYLLPRQDDWVFAEWPAVECMNRAFTIIGVGDRLKPTPWVFGGNMCIHRELFRKVAFDPCVTRGEDIDYLVNARFMGYDFFLDNTLWIRHLPPPKTAPLWRRFREDLDRFVYSREKLRTQEAAEGLRHVRVEELDPYPGRFLRDDLEEMIFRTCVLMGLHYLSRGEREGFEECMANIARARALPSLFRNPFREYMAWRRRWEELMRLLAREEGLQRYVQDLFERTR